MERIKEFDSEKYLIKWLDYDESENTWEQLENLLTCLELIQQFHKAPRLTGKALDGH